MHFNLLTVTSFLALASAAAEQKQPYQLAARSVNPAFGLAKRQAGYQPSQTFCSGSGDCAEACGAGYETCASTDDNLHCYDPTVAETCCPTGTGDSCSEGYYCTQASDLTVWCCPDGMDLASCAAYYSLTGSLQFIAASTAITPISSVGIPTTPAGATTTSEPHTTHTTPVGTVSPLVPTKSNNVTLPGSSTGSATPVPFTGSAAGRKNFLIGGSVLIAAVGVGFML